MFCGCLKQVWVHAQVLRDTLNCTLPIEIIYNGPLEMDAWAIQKFEVRLTSQCRWGFSALSVHWQPCWPHALLRKPAQAVVLPD